MVLSKNRKIANLLDKDSGFVKKTLSDSDQIVISGNKGIASTSAGTTVYATLGDLPGSASAGEQAFVSANNGLYIYNGSGWYKVALVNSTPYWITQPDSEYAFYKEDENLDSEIVIVVEAGDSDGHNLTYSTLTDSDLNQFATITKDSDGGRTFTISLKDVFDSESTQTGEVVFKVTDGINILTKTITISYIYELPVVYGSMDFGTTSTDNPVNVNFASGYQNLGSGDFTIEGWVYRDNTGNHLFATTRTNVSTVSNGDWWIDVYLGELRVMFKDSSGNARYMHNYTNTSFASGSWIHFAAVREGTTGRLYFNGTQESSLYINSDSYSLHGSEGAMSLGGFYDTNNYAMAGHISNFRISAGHAVYPSGTTFTPPTAPLGINDNANWSVVLAHDPNSIDTVLESTPGIVSSITKNTAFPSATSDNPFS